MKKYTFFALAALALMFAACSSSQKSTGVWVNTEKIQGKQFSKVFIVVMTADVEARSTIESDLAKAAEARGYTAVKSLELMPPNLKNPEKPGKDEIAARVKESGCDAVFVASLLRKDEDVRYNPGSAAYTIRPFYTWHGNFIGYYNHWWPNIYQPGYYATDRSYFMQSNLYDVASEEIMWSVQSEVFNPTSIARFSKNYTNTLIKQLEKEGLLKK